MNELAKEMITFIDTSPSCYHVIDNLKNMLKEEKFQELREEELWNIKNGGKYYVTRTDSSLIAFKVPEKEFENFQICSSHSDSPSFKIKENPEMQNDSGYVELNVEKYGGMIYAPWFDRPLSVAGKLIVGHNDWLEPVLVNVDRDLLMIPNVAIHMNREVNEGYRYNAQKDMIPILGQENAKGKFLDIIAQSAGVKKEDIKGYDLFLYNRVAGTIWGAQNEFISDTRLDDLECAYTSMKAFIGSGNDKSITMCCIFDNEEVGSTTKQGADSTFLSDTIERICDCLDTGFQKKKMALAKSFMLSADNAHAVHPHHLSKADPTNKPYMNGGIVIKFNANQKYTTDSVSASVFRTICDKAGVKYQTYINRSDIAGGSTLGNIANTHVSIDTVDIGLAQLAMHSPYETAGVYDIGEMVKAIGAFYNTHISKSRQGISIS